MHRPEPQKAAELEEPCLRFLCGFLRFLGPVHHREPRTSFRAMRKVYLAGLVIPFGIAVITASAHDHPKPVAVTVYKNAQCGCCKGWVEHLRQNGFEVTANDVDDLAAIKSKLGVPGALTSCHTAVVGRYVVEGHVPAADIRKLLEEKPKVVGIGVPGMPVGSPGMEAPGRRPDRYDVTAFAKDGSQRVFASH